MDFELSDDQQQLRDTVRSVLQRECPPTVVRAAYEGRDATNERAVLWQKMLGLDWPAIAVPSALGGLGLGYVELALVVEEIGRAAAPSPYMASVTQFAPTILECGSPEQQKTFLGPLVDGGATGALAVAERNAGWDLDRLDVIARRTSGGWVLDGRKSYVLDGASADHLAVVARGAPSGESRGIGVFVVPGDSVAAQPIELIDPTQPLAEVVLAGVEVADDSVLIAPDDPRGDTAVQRAMEQATAALALSVTGTCRAIFDTTLQYVKDREQFGRPIGSFQAVKHRLVDMFVSLERASSLAYFAALTIAEDDQRRSLAVSMAKAAAGECQRLVVQEGLQLHGGVGFMWEQDLHFFLKRAKAGDFLFGSGQSHRAAVARTLGLVAS